MKRSGFLTGLSGLTLAPLAASAQLGIGDDAIQLKLVADEPQAVLAILSTRAAGAVPSESQWNALFASEGYRRLADRERSFKRPFDDAAFRAFVGAPELLARRAPLAATLQAWSHADVAVCGRRALAYLPSGSRLHASVYPEIKPSRNSFVFDLEHDPGIFLYLDPAISPTVFTYTVAHELHHVGFAQNCPTPAVRTQIERLPPRLKTFQDWLGAFGEGFAVLAGAGGADVDPATVVGAESIPEWKDERATFAPRMAQLAAFFHEILSGKLTGDAARDAGLAFFGTQGPWYTVGWRMAVTIERRFGRNRLIECIADNRLFIPTYNSAANGTQLPRWDDDLARAFMSP